MCDLFCVDDGDEGNSVPLTFLCLDAVSVGEKMQKYLDHGDICQIKACVTKEEAIKLARQMIHKYEYTDPDKILREEGIIDQ